MSKSSVNEAFWRSCRALGGVEACTGPWADAHCRLCAHLQRRHSLGRQQARVWPEPSLASTLVLIGVAAIAMRRLDGRIAGGWMGRPVP